MVVGGQAEGMVTVERGLCEALDHQGQKANQLRPGRVGPGCKDPDRQQKGWVCSASCCQDPAFMVHEIEQHDEYTSLHTSARICRTDWEDMVGEWDESGPGPGGREDPGWGGESCRERVMI